MRLIFPALLLAFALFFTSIELSSQSSRNHSSQGSRRTDQQTYSGEEPSIWNEGHHSSNSANSRTGRRHVQQTLSEESDGSSSNTRQRNANRASSSHQRLPPSRSLEQEESQWRRREEGYPRNFEQEGNSEHQVYSGRLFGQGQHQHQHQHQQQQQQSDSSSHYSYISYSLPPSSSEHQSPRGPLSLDSEFSSDSSHSINQPPSHNRHRP